MVRSGLDRLRDEGFARLKGARIGVLCNQASVDSRLDHILDLLLPLDRNGFLKVQAVFGPQHGLFGHTQDNMIEWEGAVDPRTGWRVFSLYGERREPTDAMLDGVELLAVDLQDVGARYYTFIWTMSLCMRACRRLGIPVLVLDRPNPIGGLQVEGTVLDPAFASFVGLHPLPMRHGMTLGEISRFLGSEAAPQHLLTTSQGRESDSEAAPRNISHPLPPPSKTNQSQESDSEAAPRNISHPLPPPSKTNHFEGWGEILLLEGWRREMYFEDTGLPWAMPSPNMPSVDTAVVYPGGCLLEGTNLSEGRGTTRPFEIVGAPYLDAWAYCGALNGLGLAGVRFRPVEFEPTFNKHARTRCGGCFIHVLDRWSFEPVMCAVSLMQEAIRLAGDAFRWKEPPYEYEYEKRPIDILAGNGWLAREIENLTDHDTIRTRFAVECNKFASQRFKMLLY